MSAPMGHDRSRKPSEIVDDEDLVDKLLNKTGCADQHYSVQLCMFEKKDWRQCQTELKAFRKCIEDNKAQENKES